MANVCLPPKLVDKFKGALISGRINPGKLEKMTSDERRKLFTDIVGEGNARQVNALFESKMLLKNQQRGYLTWAKKVTGISEETRRDLISRIERLDRVLEPEQERAFLKDLAAARLGLDVTAKEAKEMARLSKALQKQEAKKGKGGTFTSEADRMAYGYAKVDLGDYIAGLKLEAGKRTISEQARHPVEVISKTAGLAKSLKASLDNSAIFRQGWKTIWTSPGSWQKNARQTFVDMKRTFGGEAVMREIKAEIVSRPNYDRFEKMKLAIGNIEEEFPSSLPERIPGIGRAFKASSTAYEGFLYRMRADIADKYLEVAERQGVNINDKKELEAIGLLVNSLTGRGNIGRFEGSAATTMNNVFFSVRFFKANIDTLTAHGFGAQKGMTPFARRRAAQNLVQIAAGTAAVLAVADAVLPGSVDWDPRSSDFGKIKVGNTRFEVTGGMGSIVTIASQIITQEQKSAGSGIVKKLGEGYGSEDGLDKVFNFFSNKFSPAAAFVRDIVRQQDFKGDPLSPKKQATDLLVPIPVTTNYEAWKDPNAAPGLLVFIADALGIGASTYGRTERSTAKLSDSQRAFKEAVGPERFEAANHQYELQVDAWLASNKEAIRALPNDERQSVLTAGKTKIQKQIYSDYGYKPEKKQDSDTLKQQKKDLLNAIP